MRKIGIINQKGGVAKTTTCINLAAALRRLKKKVCVIDMDPQSHLTYGLGIDPESLNKSVFELLKGEATLEEVIIDRDGIGVIPSHPRLSAADRYFASEPGSDYILKSKIKDLQGADYVLIDNNPSLGLLTLNTLAYINEIFIPCQTEFLALQGISELLKTVEVVKERLNPELEITGVILTMYDKRRKITKEIEKSIKEYFDKKLFKSYIRENVALVESISHGQTIFEYQPKSNGAIDYTNLAKEVSRRKK